MTELHSLTEDLNSALQDGDERRTDEAVSRILRCVAEGDNAFGLQDVQTVNQLLRDHQQHDYMIAYGEMLSSEGRNTFDTDKHYAQAQIDTGHAQSALPILTLMLRDSDARNDPEDFSEASGLIGRVHKDLYLAQLPKDSSEASRHLERAFSAYWEPWHRAPEERVWHGVNLLALASSASANDYSVPDMLSPDDVADSVIESIGRIEEPNRSYWDWASLAEAQVWKENWQEATLAIVSALETGKAQPFMLNGTLRQFKEVWFLQDRGEDAAVMVTWLERNVLGQPNGEITLDSKDIHRQRSVTQEQLQALHSHHRMRSDGWMRKYIARGSCVASVVDISTDEPVGTCSVLDGKWFSEELAGQLVLLTNDHVVSEYPDEYSAQRRPLRPEEAAVRFTGSQSPDEKFTIRRVIWSSPYGAHDACLFEIEGKPPVEESNIPLVSYVPKVDAEKPAEVFLISHPEKDGVSYSFQNTDLIDHDAISTGKDGLIPGLIHYTTPSIPGSSGGIALNASLEMIGLHHAGGTEINRLNGQPGSYAVNEAIWIQPILNSIKLDLANGRRRWFGD